MWLRLFQCILPERVKLSSVNPLRGRETVLKACKNDQEEDGRKRIYIIDGDFDFIKGRKKPNYRRLYRIRAYCIENLLISREAIEEIVIDSMGENDRGRLWREVDLQACVWDHENLLRYLFCIYAAAHDVAPDIKTVGLSITNLLCAGPKGAPTLSVPKVRRRAAEILYSIRRKGLTSEFVRRKQMYIQNCDGLDTDLVVSGKTYLLPLIWLNIRRSAKYKGNIEQFKIHLAKQFRRNREPYLFRAVNKIVQRD
ncbi:DUF4435 domain-containing protein [Aquibium oceanicum]